MTWGDYVVPIFNLSLNCIELWTSQIGFGNFDLDSLSIFFAKRLMGLVRLGKTLQSITLLWTLLKQGFDGRPMAKRVLIITPTSLVSNWESEIKKWLNHRTINVLAMCESTRADVLQGIATFLAPHSLYQVL
jgi:hypothetical protein